MYNMDKRTKGSKEGLSICAMNMEVDYTMKTSITLKCCNNLYTFVKLFTNAT